MALIISHTGTESIGVYAGFRRPTIPKPVSFHSLEYQLFLRHLRAARQAAGLTQEEVARRLNKPQSYVSKCQSGERRMDMVEIRAFCQAIEKPLAEFAAEFDLAAAALGKEAPEP